MIAKPISKEKIMFWTIIIALIVIGALLFFVLPLVLVFCSKDCRKLIKEELDGTADKRRKEAKEEQEREEARQRKEEERQRKFEEANASYESPFNKKLLRAPEELKTHAIRAQQLCNAYESNPFAADEKYKGETIVIRGEVKEIGRNASDDAFIRVASDGSYDVVDCFVDESLLYILPQLKRDQYVYVIGDVLGTVLNDGIVHMVDCAIYKAYN